MFWCTSNILVERCYTRIKNWYSSAKDMKCVRKRLEFLACISYSMNCANHTHLMADLFLVQIEREKHIILHTWVQQSVPSCPL